MTGEQKSPSSPRPAPTVGPRLWAQLQSQRHSTQEGVRLLQHVFIFRRAAAGPSDTAALRPAPLAAGGEGEAFALSAASSAGFPACGFTVLSSSARLPTAINWGLESPKNR